jgi:hypothetical protein
MFDSERKQPNLSQFAVIDSADDNSLKRNYVPHPYNFDFTLTLFVKSQSEGLQIMEQIIPFFRPSFNVTVTETTELAVKRDVAIVLNDITPPAGVEGGLDDRRLLEWEFGFTLKGYLYGPVRSTGVIKEVIVDIHAELDEDVVSERYTVEPDPDTAIATDDFGFTETFEFYPDS